MYTIESNEFCDTELCEAKVEKDNDFKCGTKKWQDENCKIDAFTQLIIVCYFALTTLSTVGYGDLYPISIPELILGIVFMLVGIVFFSQMMGSFIDIIKKYQEQ